MFADIHGTYDFLNHFLSMGRDHAWRRRTARLLGLASHERVLDLCAGTGDLALELASHEPALVVAADFTPEMLVKSVQKAGAAGRTIRHAVADALALPFADASFDALTVAFGIRNVADLDAGLRELARVLRPGGRAGILEFSRSRRRFSRGLHAVYCGAVLPVIGRLVSGHRTAYSYLPASIDEFPEREELASRMIAAGFSTVEITPMNFDLVTLHLGVIASSDRASSAAPSIAAHEATAQ